MARDRGVTPKSLVLDLLRVGEPRSIAVRSFVEIGELFGFTGNAMRVAVTRLVSAGLLESDDRGSYRLAPSATPLSAHVEAWRLGEKRRRPWSGNWLAVWLPRGAQRRTRRQSLRALALLGFGEGLEALWVRPDNLAAGSSGVFAELGELGLESEAEPFLGSGFSEPLGARWQRSLWRPDELTQGYRGALRRIEQSLEKIDRLAPGPAAVETFLVGGAAIRVLATDPLLPDEILPGDDRAALTAAMRRYDVVGRRVWRTLTGARELSSAPSHLSLVAGGRP